jgi:glycosyltransferase involved in cell wall biosynthesis
LEDKIKINYIYQENQGKYRAINRAVDIANGELFMIVDSDDSLTSNAIELIEKYYLQIKDKKEFLGLVGLRGNSKQEAYTSYLHEKKRKKNKYYDLEYIDASYIEYRYKYKISGDRAEVCRTEELKKIKFPTISNEKAMAEGYLWFETSKRGFKFRYFNSVIYITEYLEDGWSANAKEVSKKSPINTIFLNNYEMNIKEIPIMERLKKCINYYRYGKYVNYKIYDLFKECNCKLLSLIAIIIAIFKPIKKE